MMHAGRAAKRGGELRQHIMWIAREVFLEGGFERASMDVVAARAGTTKKTVYAHFESKERLFVATFEMLRGFFLERLATPDAYADEPNEALARFCGRFMEMLLWDDAVRMARVCASEAARFGGDAAEYCYAIFADVERKLAAYIVTASGIASAQGTEFAQRLMGRVLYPRYMQTLFGVIAPLAKFDEAQLADDFDLEPMRRAVRELNLPPRDRAAKS
ncbi:MAG: TetR/AcrR family transcriptional regulator [bacterium]|nr:TetR/AcrR family transcriptional regulator [bacterium]